MGSSIPGSGPVLGDEEARLLVARYGALALACEQHRRTVAWVVERLRTVPREDLGRENYGIGTCTMWEEHVDEHEDADEDEKPATTYTMICEGAERVRGELLKALR